MIPQYLKTEGSFKAEAFRPDGGWLTRSKSGTAGVQIGLKVVDDAEEEGKVMVWYGWLSDKAIERTVETLTQCFGFDGDLNGLHSGRTSFEGLPCEFTSESEEYEGKSRLKVKWLNPPGYVRSAPTLADDDAKAILATLGSKVKALAIGFKAAPPAPKKAATPKPAPVPAGPEDDVPF